MASTDTDRATPVNTPNAKTHIAWNADTRLTPLAAMHGIVSLDFPPAWLPAILGYHVTHVSYRYPS
jgi:hypothetical protein